jgi:hypothetical protein
MAESGARVSVIETLANCGGPPSLDAEEVARLVRLARPDHEILDLLALSRIGGASFPAERWHEIARSASPAVEDFLYTLSDSFSTRRPGGDGTHSAGPFDPQLTIESNKPVYRGRESMTIEAVFSNPNYPWSITASPILSYAVKSLTRDGAPVVPTRATTHFYESPWRQMEQAVVTPGLDKNLAVPLWIVMNESGHQLLLSYQAGGYCTLDGRLIPQGLTFSYPINEPGHYQLVVQYRYRGPSRGTIFMGSLTSNTLAFTVK